MSDRVRGDLLLVLVTLIAAAGWLFSKNALMAVPPFLFIGVRFLMAGTILAVLYRGALAQLSGAQWWLCIKTGLLFGLALLLWIMGLFHSEHLGEASFIASLAVIMIPLVGRLVYGDRLSLQLLLPMLLAVAGLAVLTLDGEVKLELSQLYLLAAALCFALQFVLTARHVTQMPPMGLAAVQMTAVSVVALAAAAVWEPISFDWGLEAWGWVLASGLIASLLADLCPEF